MADMLDIILIVCIIITAVGGIFYLILPADKLVKKDKLKNGETMEDATKKVRRGGVLYLVFAFLLFLFNFVI